MRQNLQLEPDQIRLHDVSPTASTLHEPTNEHKEEWRISEEERLNQKDDAQSQPQDLARRRFPFTKEYLIRERLI